MVSEEGFLQYITSNVAYIKYIYNGLAILRKGRAASRNDWDRWNNTTTVSQDNEP